MLEVKDIHVHYGAIHALKGVTLNVKQGEIVTLIGSASGYTISLDTIAQMMNTLNNEIALHVNPRVPRVYLSGNECFVKLSLF